LAVSALLHPSRKAPDPFAAPQASTLPRRLVAEGFGTAVLLATVVGSGIMGERLAAGNMAIALLANSLATAGALAVLILIFGPVSGAHFNPAVTLTVAIRRDLRWAEVPLYFAVQVASAVVGVALAHIMFEAPLFSLSTHMRSGPAQMFSEFVATLGLLAVILGCARHRVQAMPYAVASYIGAAYWFTASTSFANPAVTIARSLTNTFSGIRPADVPAFVLAQIAGVGGAILLFGWLFPKDIGERPQGR
jgi:glycerol uptake facilitator-like aquaporin